MTFVLIGKDHIWGGWWFKIDVLQVPGSVCSWRYRSFWTAKALWGAGEHANSHARSPHPLCAKIPPQVSSPVGAGKHAPEGMHLAVGVRSEPLITFNFELFICTICLTSVCWECTNWKGTLCGSKWFWDMSYESQLAKTWHWQSWTSGVKAKL